MINHSKKKEDYLNSIPIFYTSVFYVCSIGGTMMQEIKKLEKEGMLRCEEFISVSEILFLNISIKHIGTKQKNVIPETKEELSLPL